MIIRGGMFYIIFDMENGYVLRAAGELEPGAKFCVYKSSLRHWEPPHEKEPLTQEQIAAIIKEAESMNGEGRVGIRFE